MTVIPTDGIRVTTQEELDAALAESSDRHIYIDSPAGVWLNVRDFAEVYAYDSSSVFARDSATVWAYNSARVRAFDFATVYVYAYGRTTVQTHARSVTVNTYN